MFKKEIFSDIEKERKSESILKSFLINDIHFC